MAHDGQAAGTSARWMRRLGREPDDVEALYGYFDALVEERGARWALQALEAWGTKARAPSVGLVLGYCLFGLGRTDEAVEQFRRAHRTRPREPTLYGLTSALIVQGRPGEARRLLAAADRRRPLTARLLVSLANAHLAEGHRAGAQAALRRITPRGASDWSELVDSARDRARKARRGRGARSQPRAGRRNSSGPRAAGKTDWLWQGPAGAIFVRVKARPGARTSRLRDVDSWRGALAVEVQAPPQGGAANEAIAEVLARALGATSRQVELVHGARASQKVFRLRGVTLAEARLRLEAKR